MSGIFFSYRRADSLPIVQGMHDWFLRGLPLHETFFDLVTLRSGEEFPERITSFITDASVVLVIIGPGWATASDAQGRRRLAIPDDWVRREILLALELNKPMIPVLVGGIEFPDLSQIPEEIRPLFARKNAHWVTSGPDFAVDLARLAENIVALAPNDFLLSRSADGATTLLFSVAERRVYLEWLIANYSQIALPIDPDGRFPLDRIFQPLQLRRDPVLTEDIHERAERRALLGDPTVSEDDPHYRRMEEEGRDADRKGQRRDRDGQEKQETVQPVVTATDGADALQKSASGRMIVLGGPGTGKTTLLRQMTTDAARRALADPSAPVPILLSLPVWGVSGQTLQTYLTTLLTDHEFWLNEHRYVVAPAYAATLWTLLTHGQAWLALDGLDEVGLKVRGGIITTIKQMAIQYGGTWVIGSRFTEYKGQQFDDARFTEWELKPLNSAARRELARRLLPVVHGLIYGPNGLTLRLRAATDFVEALERHPTVSSWGENPLLFSLAEYVYTKRQALPASRAELYQEVVDAIVAMREPDPETRPDFLLLAAEVALVLFEQQGRIFDDVALRDATRLALQHFQMLTRLEDIGEYAGRLKRCGLLDTVSAQTYGFRHLTLQEYLTGRALAHWQTEPGGTRRSATRELVEQKATRSRWGEALRLMLGVLDQRAESRAIARAWIAAWASRHQTAEGDPGLLYLGTGLRALGELTPDPPLLMLGTTIIADWASALRDASLQGRTRLQERLLNLGRSFAQLPPSLIEVAMRSLLILLRDDHWRVRQAAAQALGAQDRLPPEGVQALVQRLGDTDSDVRQAAVQALGAQGDRLPPEGVQELVQRLGDDDWQVRQAAVRALGAQGDRLPPEQWLTLLGDDDWQVRQAAVRALGAQGDRLPPEQWLTLLGDDDWRVREAAAQALGAQGDRLPPAGVQALVQRLGDTKSDVRRAAALALGAQGDRLPPEQWLTLLGDDDWRVREAAAQALGAQGDRLPPEGVQALVQRLGDTDRDVRRAAAQALGAQGDRLPPEQWLTLLGDDDWRVREAAAQALGAQGDRLPPAGVQALVQRLGDAKSDVRQAAAQALGAQGDPLPPEGVQALVQRLGDDDLQVRRAAAQALGAQGDRLPPEGVQALVQRLGDDDWQVRQAAVQALGAQGDRLPPEQWLTLLGDANPFARQAAAQALGAQGDRLPPEGMQALVQRLRDTDSNVRQAAVQALGAQGDRLPPEGMQALVQRLRDTDSNVRQAAVQALGAQGDRLPPEGMQALVQRLRDTDSNVRQAAVQALGAQGDRLPPEGMQALVQRLRDTDSNVRQAVVQALGAQGDRLPPEQWLTLLGNANPFARQAAVQALGAQGDRLPPEGVQALVQRLGDTNSDVQRAAAQALGAQGDRLSPEQWLTFLGNDDWQVRQAAVQALGAQGDRLPPDQWLTLLRDANPFARQAAVQAMGVQGDRLPPEGVQALVQRLGDTNSDVRLAAVQALGAQGDRLPPEGVQALVQRLGDDDWLVRRAAAQALGAQGDRLPPEGVQALVQRQGDTYSDVRQAAAQALVAQSYRLPPKGVQALVQRLGNEDSDVRQAAVQALGAQGGRLPPEGVQALVQRLGDTDSDVRQAAAQALGAQGDRLPPEGVQALVQRLGDVAWQVRQAAVQALGAQGGRLPPEGVQALIRALSDSYQTNGRYAVRESAIQTLRRLPAAWPWLQVVGTEAIRYLAGGKPGEIELAIIEIQLAEAVGAMNKPPLQLLLHMGQLLKDWPYWEVKVAAAEALGQVRRGIPDATIKTLLELWHVREPRSVWVAVDDALGEILATDTIEDD